MLVISQAGGNLSLWIESCLPIRQVCELHDEMYGIFDWQSKKLVEVQKAIACKHREGQWWTCLADNSVRNVWYIKMVE